MNVLNEVNMKKEIHCHENWLTALPLHEAIFHHMAFTSFNREINFQDWPFSYPLLSWYYINSGKGLQRYFMKQLFNKTRNEERQLF